MVPGHEVRRMLDAARQIQWPNGGSCLKINGTKGKECWDLGLIARENLASLVHSFNSILRMHTNSDFSWSELVLLASASSHREIRPFYKLGRRGACIVIGRAARVCTKELAPFAEYCTTSETSACPRNHKGWLIAAFAHANLKPVGTTPDTF